MAGSMTISVQKCPRSRFLAGVLQTGIARDDLPGNRLSRASHAIHEQHGERISGCRGKRRSPRRRLRNTIYEGFECGPGASWRDRAKLIFRHGVGPYRQLADRHLSGSGICRVVIGDAERIGNVHSPAQ